ncbi:TPA: hypothetical protein N3G98_004756 [Salmonella enterica subsp. enterica serovar Denver]|nr:hypothetical protein [Salmonella enterica subsp. enterica serovar Denver]ECD5430700.1 hypothetical protein [Salmonella enterica subsp. enterica serovar Denver]HCM3794562.1 hypothetical protein [Salmonella enterica subsp. enterica serovar Denver]
MTDKQGSIPVICPVTVSAIHDAMFSSLEGYVSAVVDSIEFESGRELSSSEHQYVYHIVEGAVTRLTGRADSAEVNHG